jgi:predicted nucleic acid-binding protein
VRICLDASVAVSGHQLKEPEHAVARARVDRVFAGSDVLVVPAIFPIEVASALSRAGVGARAVNDYLDLLLVGAELVAIGPKRWRRVAAVAMATKLRAADASYAWVAGRENVPLVTLDGEVLRRATSVCAVETP